MVNETKIENVKDAIAVASAIVESAQKEVIWILPTAVLGLGAHYGLNEMAKKLIEKGGRVRGIIEDPDTHFDVVPEHLNNGEEVRLLDRYQGTFMLVADKRESLSSINVKGNDLSLDDRIVAFWTDNQSYADFLVATFEAEWNEAVDAEKAPPRTVDDCA
jgi:hypothetical protein